MQGKCSATESKTFSWNDSFWTDKLQFLRMAVNCDLVPQFSLEDSFSCDPRVMLQRGADAVLLRFGVGEIEEEDDDDVPNNLSLFTAKIAKTQSSLKLPSPTFGTLHLKVFHKLDKLETIFNKVFPVKTSNKIEPILKMVLLAVFSLFKRKFK